MMKRKIGFHEVLRRDDGLIPVPITVLGVTITIMFAVLVAVAAGTTGMVHKKNTDKVGGMTFQQVLDSDTPKATPTPAPVDSSSSSNSQPAQQVQPVEPPPQVVVIGGGTDDSSSTHSGSSGSSSSTTNCKDSPMFPIPRLQDSHAVPESGDMTPAPTPGC